MVLWARDPEVEWGQMGGAGPAVHVAGLGVGRTMRWGQGDTMWPCWLLRWQLLGAGNWRVPHAQNSQWQALQPHSLSVK